MEENIEGLLSVPSHLETYFTHYDFSQMQCISCKAGEVYHNKIGVNTDIFRPRQHLNLLIINKYYNNLHMATHKIDFISLSIIDVAAVLMVVTAPTLENQASAVSQPVVKKISIKDPPSKVKKDPPRKR
jgi:hypothetical protein